MEYGILAYTGQHQKFLEPTGKTKIVLGYFGRYAVQELEEKTRLYFMECTDCGTAYPIMPNEDNTESIRCNGKRITKCPYCSDK